MRRRRRRACRAGPARRRGARRRSDARCRRARARSPRSSRSRARAPRSTAPRRRRRRRRPRGRSRRAGRGRAAAPSACTSAAGCRCARARPSTQRLHGLVARLVREVARGRARSGRSAAGRRRPCRACSVLKMKARVRSPGSSPSVIASAAPRRTSLSDDWSFESATSSDTSPRSSSLSCASRAARTVIAEVTSENRRVHAPRPVTDFSAESRSSGSLRRWAR